MEGIILFRMGGRAGGIGPAIVQLAMDMGYSPAQFAAALGKNSAAAISYWSSGRHQPTALTLLRIAFTLSLSHETFRHFLQQGEYPPAEWGPVADWHARCMNGAPYEFGPIIQAAKWQARNGNPQGALALVKRAIEGLSNFRGSERINPPYL